MRKVLVTAEQALQLLPHRKYDQAQTVLISGTRGFGKTFLQKGYLETTEPRVLVLDAKQEYETIRYRVDPDEALDELAEGGPMRRRIAPPVRLNARAFAEQVFRRILNDEIGDFLLVLDEISRWTSNRSSEAFECIVTQARDIGVRTVVGCQRPSQAPTILRSETTEAALFHTQFPADLEYLEEWFGPEIPETLPKLRVGQCLLMLDL